LEYADIENGETHSIDIVCWQGVLPRDATRRVRNYLRNC